LKSLLERFLVLFSFQRRGFLTYILHFF